jgi:uncharacterized Zn-binding protein involved in type VI secretion
MGIQVTQGALLACSFGLAPSSLSVIPKGQPVQAGGSPAANISDHMPTANIAPFGMCTCPANPQVAAATAAAAGVLTPQPCIPVTTAPWTPGAPTVTINGQPALITGSTCLCTWGGVVSITSPGTATTVMAG